MIKVISFDIGGTLIEFDEDTSNNYSLKALANLAEVPYENVRTVYKDIFQKMNGTFIELVDEFCNRLNIKKEDKIIDFFEKKFPKNNTVAVISDEKIEIIKKLKDLGYQVILFSNSCCLVDNSAVKKLENLFDGIFYSYDLGYTKNEAESYHYIEKTLNKKANEFLHVGDTLKSDYYAPIENGWNAIYYGTAENKEIESIQDLKEILEILQCK